MPPSIFIQENIPLAPLTTLGVGGSAWYFATATTADELREAAAFARGKSLPIFMLGGGSNIVIADEGFPGLVIRNDIRGFSAEPAGSRVRARVGAGEEWDEVVAKCVERNLAGLELLSGIPGKAGGAPVQNIGAYGQEVSAAIAEVEAFDFSKTDTVRLSNEDCGFSYRDSIFKVHPHTKRALSLHGTNARSGMGASPGRYCITRVVFSLTPGGAPHISAYPDIATHFEGRQGVPTLLEVREAVIEIRARKGMVISEEYESYASVGSFFKNPIVSHDIFLSAKEKLSADSEGRKWSWDLPDGNVKISAAYLIEQSGFPRGYRDGAVGISPKHTLALVNLGGGAAGDVIRLARAIRGRVREMFGITLEPEAQFVGFAENPLG